MKASSPISDTEQADSSSIIDLAVEPELENEIYWNIPSEKISDSEEGSSDQQDFMTEKCKVEKSDKRYYGSSSYEEDFSWLYFSQAKHGWMCKICEKYPYNAGPSKGAFSI